MRRCGNCRGASKWRGLICSSRLFSSCEALLKVERYGERNRGGAKAIGVGRRSRSASARQTGKDTPIPSSARTTIDPTAATTPPFRSVKSPASSLPNKSTSNSTRRRKTTSRGKTQADDPHQEATGTDHFNLCLSIPADLTIFSTRTDRP